MYYDEGTDRISMVRMMEVVKGAIWDGFLEFIIQVGTHMDDLQKDSEVKI